MGVPGTPSEIPPCPPDNEGKRFSLLPGALAPFSALGNRFSLLPGALAPFSALGNRFSLLPGALVPFSAPGNWFFLLPGALAPFSAPSNHFSFSRNRRDGKSGRKAWRESRLDQVHFEGLYQVHRICPKGAFEAGSVDLVHPVKSDQVHREGPQFLLGGRSNVAGQARPPGASKAPGEPR